MLRNLSIPSVFVLLVVLVSAKPKPNCMKCEKLQQQQMPIPYGVQFPPQNNYYPSVMEDRQQPFQQLVQQPVMQPALPQMTHSAVPIPMQIPAVQHHQVAMPQMAQVHHQVLPLRHHAQPYVLPPLNPAAPFPFRCYRRRR